MADHMPVNDAYRAAIFWSFNDALDQDRLAAQMDALLAAGLNPGFLHTRVGLMDRYMSPAWLDAVASAVDAAKARHTHVWLYDEDRWPSGYGGGEVTLRHPELAACALVLLPEEEQARHNCVRIYGGCERGGQRYLFALCRQRNGESDWFGGGAYPDLLNPRATDAFLEVVHARYAARVGSAFGDTVRGVFFDEPNYIRRGAHFSVPFTEGFDAFFTRLHGYSILPHLAGLFFDEGAYHTLRLDFYTAATRLFAESFTARYHSWCRENQLLLTGHFVHEDTLTWQAEFTGAAMPHYPHMDIPGIDKLGLGNDKPMTVLQVTSVAAQFRRRALCEGLGCIGHQSGPEPMKSLTDWLAVLGISFLNPHLALYSMRGERKRDYPPNISWMQPWFAASRPYWDHVARVSEAVHTGESAVDLLVLHPMTSVWAEMSPLHKHNPVSSIWTPVNPHDRQNFLAEVEQWEKPFMDLTERLLADGLAHHYGDELILAEHARVEGDCLIVGQQAYRTVIVPPSLVIRDTTLALLRALAQAAGPASVIFMERHPAWVHGARAPEDFASWSTLADGREKVLRLAHARDRSPVRVYRADTGARAKKVLVDARREGGRLHALVANTDALPCRIRIAVDGANALEAVDTMTGEVFRLPVETAEGGCCASVLLRQSGSLLLRATDRAAELPPVTYLQSGLDCRGPLTLLEELRPAGTVLRDNLVPLDRVSFAVPGQPAVDNAPVESLWKRFYALPDGTPFTLAYRFTIGRMPSTPLHAMIEMARNLESVQLNGRPLDSMEMAAERDCFDFAYDRLPLTDLRLGENVLTLRGVKCNNIIGMANHRAVRPEEAHRPTELEAVYLTGQFRAALAEGGPVIWGDWQPHVAGDVTRQGFPFYAGEMRYTFAAPQAAKWLHVEADANAAQLSGDGIRAQTAYLRPYAFDIAGHGGRPLTLMLYGSLANSHGPLHLRDRDRLAMIGPALIYNEGLYQPEPVLFPFGVHRVTAYA